MRVYETYNLPNFQQEEEKDEQENKRGRKRQTEKQGNPNNP